MKNNNPLKFNITLDNSLFDQWQEELSLRRQLRISAGDMSFKITAEKDLDILWRSLYFTDQKIIFLSYLAENMHLSPILSWLSASEARLKEFLAFLPDYLRQNKLENKKLQFLVNLYNEKFNDHFISIIAALDTNTCELLASRSANLQWRKLINQHLQFIKEKRKSFFYGIDEQATNSTFPTIQGDKISLLATGIELIQISISENIKQSARLNIMLEASDYFFRAGMVGESLALLSELYKEYPVELSDKNDYLFKRQFSKLLRKVAAIYSLLNIPASAGYYMVGIYQNHFPLLPPDFITQKYFHIYELLKLARNSSSNYELYKIAYLAEQVYHSRSKETLLLSKSDIDNGLNDARQTELKSLAEQKLVSLPHEAFITLQVVQLLVEKELADSSMANFILKKALLFFQWIPSSLFINNSLLDSLIPMVNDESRNEAVKIIEQMESFRNDNISGNKLKSGLFKSKDAAILRQITAGKYLGVL